MIPSYDPAQIDQLQQIPAFQDMQASQLAHLAAIMVRQTYTPGQIIFIEGEPSTSLWFVIEGHVKIIKQSLNGRIQGLCLMNRGKCFGSCPLFDMEKNPATAEALNDVTLFLLPKNALSRLKERDPGLVKVLLRIYSQRLEHLAHVSEVLGVWTVADRINDCLLTYANSREHPPIVELTHERLAALSGTVREVVTRHLADMEKAGIVRNEMRRIIILNPDALLSPCAYESQNTPV
jgi:CRP/FNR family transcriptional regulator